jgi:hypothetical protein
VFERDGTERADLEPVDEVLPEHYDDEVGSWTCHRDTHLDDLAIVYRGAGANDPEGFPVRGPKDLYYVMLVTSEPFPLREDPLAAEFVDKQGCRCVVVARLVPPIGIEELRRDPVIRDWGALKAGFVQAAMAMPNEVWDRLVDLDGASHDPGPGAPHRPTGRRKGRQIHHDPGHRREIEYRLESWLEQNPDSLRPFGYEVAIEGRQIYCPGHEGVMDLLCRRTGGTNNSYVVVEIKADALRRDAVAQILGYIGWLRDQPNVDEVIGIVIGIDAHIQVPWVLKATELVEHLDWSQFDLPAELRDELGLMD